MEKISFFSKFFSGALSGTFTGVVGGIIAIIIGFFLTSTVIGAIIGIPLIFIGIVWILSGPLVGIFGGFSLIKGECPYCHNKITSSKRALGVTCKACKNRLLIKNGEFFKVPNM